MLVVMAATVVSVVMLVGEILDFAGNQPIWLVSGDYGGIIDGFTNAVLLNSACIILSICYLLYINHCCSSSHGNTRWPLGGMLVAGAVGILVGHLVSVWQLNVYKDWHLPHLNDQMLAAFILRIGVTDTMHYVETMFHCCGVNSPEDYHNISPVPDSCCVLDDHALWSGWFLPLPRHAVDWDKCKRQVPSYAHPEGCLTHIILWMTQKVDFLLNDNYCAIGLVAISVALLTDVISVCVRPLVAACYRAGHLVVRLVYWDIMEDWDDTCQDKCPSLLHVL